MSNPFFKNYGPFLVSDILKIINIETDNVKMALSKALEAGASLVQDATEMPWGQTIAYVTENNGFLVEVCTPVASQA